MPIYSIRRMTIRQVVRSLHTLELVGLTLEPAQKMAQFSFGERNMMQIRHTCFAPLNPHSPDTLEWDK